MPIIIDNTNYGKFNYVFIKKLQCLQFLLLILYVQII